MASMGRLGMRAAVTVLALVGSGAGAASAQVNCNVGVDFYPGGAIRSCTLNGDHRIHTARGEPLTCANGHGVTLYENGRLQSCVLARPLTSGSLHCEAGRRVELGPDGDLTGCRALP